jgi:hypothetical protein
MPLLKYTGYSGYDPSGILTGKLYQMLDVGTHYYLWKLAEDSYWYISTNLGPLYKVGSNSFTKKYWEYSGCNFFTGSYGGDTWYLWNRNSGNWYLTYILGHGYNEWWNGDYYWGSKWFSRDSASPLNPEGTYNYRGTLRGSVYGSYASTLSITREINGWKSPNADNILGEYSAVGTESGTKTVGWKVLTGNNSLGDLTQKNNISNGEYIFEGSKVAWFDGADWILSGGKNSKPSSGYWKNSGSNPIGSYSLVYSGDEPPTPSSYTLSFKEYTIGSETETRYLGQVQIWR